MPIRSLEQLMGQEPVEQPEVEAAPAPVEEVQETIPGVEQADIPAEEPADPELSFEDIPDNATYEDIAAWKEKVVAGVQNKLRKEAEKRKQVDEDAAMFRKMMSEPERLGDFIKAMGGKVPEQEQQALPEGAPFSEYADIKGREVFDDETFTGIQSMINNSIREQLLPMIRPYGEYIESFAREQGETQWKSVAEKYPAVANKRQEVEALMQKAGLPLQQAVFAVIGPELQAQQPSPGTKQTAPSDRVQLTKPTVNAAPKTRQTQGESFRDQVRKHWDSAGLG